MTLPFLLHSEKGDAQITYVDIVPDINLPMTDLSIDINGDGFDDFAFFGTTSGTFCYELMLPQDAYDAHIMTDGDGFHKIFEYGDPLTFVYSTDYLQVLFNQHSSSDSIGPLTDVGVKFIGAFVEDPDFTYLWMRVNVTACNTTLMDYAYSTEPLFAGEGIPSCSPPYPLGYLSISPTSVKVKWAPATDALKYQIKYRSVGTPVWLTKTVTAPATNKKLSGLDCEVDYEWKIRTQCTDASFSAYSDHQNFTTMECRIGDNEENENTIYVYPNPVSNNATIYFDETVSENSTIYVFDLTGKLLVNNHIASGDNFTLDVSNLSNGIYYVEVNSGSEKMRTQLVVQH